RRAAVGGAGGGARLSLARADPAAAGLSPAVAPKPAGTRSLRPAVVGAERVRRSFPSWMTALLTMFQRHDLLRSITTLLVILVILAGIYALWLRYQIEPVTRDGKVRADMVPVAADVSGLVTEVRVSDNRPVKKGEVLFVIDRPR